MAKKQKINEEVINFIQNNKEDLALRFPGLFLVFDGIEIINKFKTRGEAEQLTDGRDFIIWHFDPLPDLVVQKLLFDKEVAKKDRKKKQNRIRQRRFYRKNSKKILEKQAEKTKKDPEKKRNYDKNWYYRDHSRTLRLKKHQRLGFA